MPDDQRWISRPKTTTSLDQNSSNNSRRLILDPVTARPTLCAGCSKIFAGELFEFEDGKIKNDKTWRGLGGLHKSIVSIYQSAANGCYLCHIVTHARPSRTISDFFVQTLHERETIKGLVIVVAFKGASPTIVQLSTPVIAESDVEKYLAKSLSAAQSFTGSDETLALARYWLRNCRTNHKACKSGLTVSYPTRLLHLRAGKAYLVNTKNTRPHGDYMTLSHCWGPEQFFRLTSETREVLTNGVPIAEFPLSFRHDMEVCLSLDIHLLWIDSYCILQGSDQAAKNDWKAEAGRMLSIYSNGCLNIAAARASNPHDGLFTSRRTELPNPIIYCKTSSKSTSMHRLTSWDETKRYHTGIPPLEPLWYRAWVFQERLVSRRLLSFGHHQISFYCRTTNESEGIKLPRERYMALTPSVFWRHYQNPDDKDVSFQELRWDQIVAAYSTLALTFPEKDKLQALAGLSEFMETKDGDKLVSGHLLSTLTSSLAWRMDPKEDSRRILGQPSWSWASTTNAVKPSGISELEAPLAMVVWPREFEDLNSYCGWILCIARFISVSLAINEHNKPIVKTDRWSIEIELDYPTELTVLSKQHTRLWIFPICPTADPSQHARTKDDSLLCYSVLVSKEVRPGCYKRVGFASAGACHDVRRGNKSYFERLSPWFEDVQRTEARLGILI